MARRSKLSDSQWAEIQRRLLSGEGTRALAKEFGVGAARVSERFSEHVPKLKNLANQLATVEDAVQKLPVPEQAAVRNLADNLRGIFNGVARAVRAGADTAAILHEQAEERAKSIMRAEPDEAGHLVDSAVRSDVTDLQIMGNRALSPALRLVIANRDRQPASSEGDDELDLSILTLEELDQAEQLAMKARGEIA